MKKHEIINGLSSFRKKLEEEVSKAYEENGSSFGKERFNSWRRLFTKFLTEHLPREVQILNSKLDHKYFAGSRNPLTDFELFWRDDGKEMASFIDSLILDIENDEYDFSEQDNSSHGNNPEFDHTSVFIVHGHDEATKERTARFVEKLGLKAIILHEQANRSRTIIEKIEAYSNVGFAIVLYTPDDLGDAQPKADQLNPRARQNVVFEHGYLMGKIGRENVVPLVTENVELPSDISGVVYINDSNWKIDIVKEMKETGYKIDTNKLLEN